MSIAAELLLNAVPLSSNVSSRNSGYDSAICRNVHKRIVATDEDEFRFLWKVTQGIGNHFTVDATSVIDLSSWRFSGKG
jgi:hypothetical protein